MVAEWRVGKVLGLSLFQTYNISDLIIINIIIIIKLLWCSGNKHHVQGVEIIVFECDAV